MKRAIEVLRRARRVQAGFLKANAEWAANPVRTAGGRELARRDAKKNRRHIAELDAAIKLLEAAPAVRELVRQGAALLRSTTSTSSSGWTALAAVLADPTLRALIDESAAGAGGDDG